MSPRSEEWAREVIKTSRGWRFFYCHFDDLSRWGKGIIIRNLPGFRFLLRLRPFYFNFAIISWAQMLENLVHGDAFWVKGKPEITIGRIQ